MGGGFIPLPPGDHGCTPVEEWSFTPKGLDRYRNCKAAVTGFTRRGLLCFFAVSLLFALGAVGAHAATLEPITHLAFTDVENTIGNVIDMLWIVLIGTSIIFTLLAGFRFLTAQGNAEQVRTAAKMLLYGVVALGVGLVAKGIVFLVEDVITGSP